MGRRRISNEDLELIETTMFIVATLGTKFFRLYNRISDPEDKEIALEGLEDCKLLRDYVKEVLKRKRASVVEDTGPQGG